MDTPKKQKTEVEMALLNPRREAEAAWSAWNNAVDVVAEKKTEKEKKAAEREADIAWDAFLSLMWARWRDAEAAKHKRPRRIYLRERGCHE